MEVTSEAGLRKWLTTKLHDAGGHVTNIESSTKNGIPDTYCRIQGFGFWIELKCDARDKPLVRKEQRVWGFNESRAGGYSCVLHYNTATRLIYIYSNPIHAIRVVGKYLEVNDPPCKICEANKCVETLLSLR